MTGHALLHLLQWIHVSSFLFTLNLPIRLMSPKKAPIGQRYLQNTRSRNMEPMSDAASIPNPIPNELVDELAFDTFFLDELSVCDINNDGFITIQDIVIMATHFGEESECPEWDVWSDRCDLNDDGIIDIVDIVLLAEHYGEAAH